MRHYLKKKRKNEDALRLLINGKTLIDQLLFRKHALFENSHIVEETAWLFGLIPFECFIVTNGNMI